MSSGRKKVNITLIILNLILGGWAAWLYRLPAPVLSPEVSTDMNPAPSAADSIPDQPAAEAVAAQSESDADTVRTPEPVLAEKERPVRQIESTTFSDADPRTMVAGHPFGREAMKILNGGLEEADSVSRRRILSYCEHLRTSYTTRDIDFIRQVFSDNALIIVGHVVRQGDAADAAGYSSRVQYSIRSKQAYLEKLARIFDSGRKIDMEFSDFRIMRHPTVKGIYGVSLRQKYADGNYSDDGYLFLLWDFRDRSMPLIHVRTWQPTPAEGDMEDELIGIGDFNLE